jgi:hypothetical protein
MAGVARGRPRSPAAAVALSGTAIRRVQPDGFDPAQCMVAVFPRIACLSMRLKVLVERKRLPASPFPWLV